MMLKPVLANVEPQGLRARDLHHARASERIQGFVRERAFPQIAANHPGAIVGGEARKAHGPTFTRPTQVSKVFSLSAFPAIIPSKSMRTS